MTEQEKDPKIIIDDDWKSQVQQEKEQLREKVESSSRASEQPQIPPASFQMLVTTLSTQSMAAIGFLPDPVTGKAEKNLPMAKHFIDTLGVLEEKTKGNLLPDEASLLTETLHQLRMAFIAVSKETPEKEPTKPSIELP